MRDKSVEASSDNGARADLLARPRQLYSWAVAAIALTALLGWILGWPLLTSWAPGAATLKPMTALCFLALVLALWAADSGHAKMTAWLGWGVAVMAALSLVQNLANLDLGIDSWLAARLGAMTPGAGSDSWRMASATAVMFMAAGAATACLGDQHRFWRVPVLAGIVGLLAAGELIVLAIVDRDAIRAAPLLSPVALATMAGFLLLAGELLRRSPLDLSALVRRFGFSLGIGGWLLALALCAALPVLLFAGFAAQRLASAERRVTLHELEQRTEATAQVVARYLQTVLELAVTLANDPDAQAQDLQVFYTFAKGAVAAGKADRAVLLVAPDGRQLLNTRLPFGAALPAYGSPEALAETLTKKTPVLSDLFIGHVTKTLLFNVTAPVMRDGQVSAIIAIGVESSDLTAVLREGRLPEGWIGGVQDSRGIIVARTHDPEKWVGQTASMDLISARVKGQRGAFSGLTSDGIAVSSYFVSLPNLGWTVAVGVPSSQLDAPAQSSLRFMLALGLASVSLAGGLAFMLGRHMHREVEDVAGAALALGDGREPMTTPTTVRELNDVTGALTAAHRHIDAREAALRESEDHWRLALQVAELGAWEVNLADHSAWRSPRHGQIFGYEEPLPEWTYEAFLQHVLEEDRAEVERCTRDAMAEHRDWTFECRIRRADGRLAWVRVSGKSISDAGGAPSRMFGVIEDITERKRAEEHKALLTGEVNHRAKNLLSVVQAIARMSASEDSPKLFAQRFGDRLAGLAASNDLLIRSEWRGVDVRDLVRSQLTHFGDRIGTRIVLDGPPLPLTPAAAQSIGMAIHELATNAGKYGALSNAEGSVRVRWEMIANGTLPRFQMKWSEQGGPPAAQPERRGFGHTVLVKMAQRALDAEVSLAYPSSGLVWQLSAPAERVTPRAEDFRTFSL